MDRPQDNPEPNDINVYVYIKCDGMTRYTLLKKWIPIKYEGSFKKWIEDQEFHTGTRVFMIPVDNTKAYHYEVRVPPVVQDVVAI